jgi:segregation and condensation protein A
MDEMQDFIPQDVPVLDALLATAEAAIPPVVSSKTAFVPTEFGGGIDVLVQMSAKGEIDPKNIDIIDVTDRFLRAIAAAPKENLRQSGKILFHASVLLRMKAEALLSYEAESAGDDFLDFDADGSPIIYDSNREPVARQITIQDLERALVRRSHVNQIRTRRVTLEQLIEALREAERMETAVKVVRRVEPKIDMEGYHEMRDVDDIFALAHDEDIDKVIERVEQILIQALDPNDLMTLVKLIQCLGDRGDWVDAFLAVLFLSNAGKITLEQEEFYGPLYLTRAS